MILDIKKWQIVMVETASGNAHFERSLASTENIDVFTLRGPQNCVQNSAHNPSLSAAMGDVLRRNSMLREFERREREQSGEFDAEVDDFFPESLLEKAKSDCGPAPQGMHEHYLSLIIKKNLLRL